MRKILALFGATVFGCGVASAFDLVAPVGKYNKTTHDSVYFMGSLDKGETLFYQTEKVKTAENGAFAFTVPLKQGRNQVLLRVVKDGRPMIKQYFITKELVTASNTIPPLLVVMERTVFKTVTEGVPLCSTPVEAGMNRMSHLSKGTNLIIDGKLGDFYRVYLTPVKYGWISKKDVVMAYDAKGYPQKADLATFYNVDDKTVKDLSMYRVAFSQNLPYEVVDNPNELLISIYNVANMNNETLILRVSKNEWVKYSTNFNNGDFTLIMKNILKTPGLPLKGLKIVVDPGHGGQEKGALGLFRDDEKNINLTVAQQLKTELESKGAVVYLTRTNDVDVDLYERVKFAKANDADIFISVHMNSLPQGADPNARHGSGVYYYNNSAKSLADSIRKSLVAELDTNDDNSHQASFAVLRTGEYLGVLAELAYMINPEDSVIYKSPDFAEKSAAAIAKGVVNYVKGVPPAPKIDKAAQKKKSVAPKKEKVKKIRAERDPKSQENLKRNWQWFGQKSVPDVDNKPFLDTSVRKKYEQEAIYVIDENDKKWYRPKGKKKRVKRPPREIKHADYNVESEINIFASGDYKEIVVQEPTFRERTRSFFSKLSSYFYNGAKN